VHEEVVEIDELLQVERCGIVLDEEDQGAEC
jgi:hypothetical protein